MGHQWVWLHHSLADGQREGEREGEGGGGGKMDMLVWGLNLQLFFPPHTLLTSCSCWCDVIALLWLYLCAGVNVDQWCGANLGGFLSSPSSSYRRRPGQYLFQMPACCYSQVSWIFIMLCLSLHFGHQLLTSYKELILTITWKYSCGYKLLKSMEHKIHDTSE